MVKDTRVPKNSHVVECRMHPREFPSRSSWFCVLRWFLPLAFPPAGFPPAFPTRGNVNGVICPTRRHIEGEKGCLRWPQVHLFKFHALVPTSCVESNRSIFNAFCLWKFEIKCVFIFGKI